MEIEHTAIFVLTVLLVLLTVAQGACVPLMQGFGWGLGSRDKPVEMRAIQGRFARTVSNHLEAMLMFIPLMGLVLALGRQNSQTELASWLVMGGRLAFIPMYLGGVFGLRSLAYGLAMAGNLILVFELL